MASCGSSIAVSAAIFFIMTLATFILYFAITFSIERLNLFPLAIAASVLNAVDIVYIMYYCFLHRLRTHGRVRLAQLLSLSIIIVITHSLSLALLIWMQIQGGQVAKTVHRQNMIDLRYAAWGVWGASVTAHAVLIAFEIRQRQQLLSTHPSMSRYILTRESGSWSPPPPDVSTVINAPYFSRSNPSFFHASPSAHEEDAATGPHKSPDARHLPLQTTLSLSTKTSDTELSLLGRKRSESESGVSPPISPSGDSETSQFTTRPTTPVKQRLEPIPGSQPNSPGNALTEMKHDANASSNAEGEHGPEADRGRNPTRIPLRFRKDGASELSQTGSPMVDESHIHPLFRTASPLPAPTPSPSSSITASAFSRRYVASPSLSRTGSRSNPMLRRPESAQGTLRRSGSYSTPLRANSSAEENIKRTRSLTVAKSQAASEDTENVRAPTPSEVSSYASASEALAV